MYGIGPILDSYHRSEIVPLESKYFLSVSGVVRNSPGENPLKKQMTPLLSTPEGV